MRKILMKSSNGRVLMERQKKQEVLQWNRNMWSEETYETLLDFLKWEPYGNCWIHLGEHLVDSWLDFATKL